MKPTSSLSSLITVGLLATALHANAEEPSGASPSVAPEASEPPSAPAVVEEPPTSASDVEATEPPVAPQRRGSHFRWGVSGVGAPMLFSSGESGFVLGADARLGVQFTDLLGLYGQPVIFVGSVSNTTVALGGFGAGLELDFDSGLFLSAGPEFGTLAATYGGASASSGVFGVAGRAGYNFGGRRGFTLALDGRVMFPTQGGGGSLFIPGLALGYEAY